MSNSSLFKPAELRAIFMVMGIVYFRSLGIFLIMPIFREGVISHLGYTPDPFYIGVAMGMYGFAHTFLQWPMGIVSDLVGRRAILNVGLGFNILGLVIMYFATSVEMVGVGRFVQGVGAVSSVSLSLISDNTREQVRSLAMGVVGICLGLSFLSSMFIGSMSLEKFGFDGALIVSMLFNLIAFLFINTNLYSKQKFNYKNNFNNQVQQSVSYLLTNRGFLILNISMLILHLIMSAFFMAMPVLFKKHNVTNQSIYYLAALLVGFALALPLIRLVDLNRIKFKSVMFSLVTLLVTALLALTIAVDNFLLLIPGVLLFFAAFVSLEAMLPAKVSKIIPADFRGAGLGMFATFQFFGMFAGSTLGGKIESHFGSIWHVWLFCVLISFIWGMLLFIPKDFTKISEQN